MTDDAVSNMTEYTEHAPNVVPRLVKIFLSTASIGTESTSKLKYCT